MPRRLPTRKFYVPICSLLVATGCARVRPLGTTASGVPALAPPAAVASVPQRQVQAAAQRRGPAATRANTPATSVPGESSRVRHAERKDPRTGQPYVPRLEYDVRVGGRRGVPPTGSAARTEFPRKALEEELDKLQVSDFEFETPNSLRAGTTAYVTFRLKDDLQQRLRAALAGRGTVANELTTRIDAALSGDDEGAFEITPERMSGAEWVWKVRARDAGDHTLNLSVTLTTMLAGENHERRFPAIRRAISVTAPSGPGVDDLIGAPWFWPVAASGLLAAILLSMALWRRGVA